MGRHLVDLTDDECWEQLASRELARIAWNTSAGPEYTGGRRIRKPLPSRVFSVATAKPWVA